jgi:hypothetical protein
MSAKTTGAASGASLSRAVTLGATDSNRLAVIADLLTRLRTSQRRELIKVISDEDRQAIAQEMIRNSPASDDLEIDAIEGTLASVIAGVLRLPISEKCKSDIIETMVQESQGVAL